MVFCFSKGQELVLSIDEWEKICFLSMEIKAEKCFPYN